MLNFAGNQRKSNLTIIIFIPDRIKKNKTIKIFW